jgi:hypothetical protein
VTTPAPPQQPGYQLASQVAYALSAALTVQAALQILLPLFLAARIRRQALAGALVIVYRFPPEVLGMIGPATRTAIAMNIMRRAQFVVAAAERLNGDWQRALADGRDPVQALAAGMMREQRYYMLHIAAIRNRAEHHGCAVNPGGCWAGMPRWTAAPVPSAGPRTAGTSTPT